jgi:hypothetical protein
MGSRYEAAWLPLADQTEGVDPTILAVGHVGRLCDEHGVRGVLVTHHLPDAATPSLERFAANHLHATLRSRVIPQGGAPVLVDMPNARLLEVAHHGAGGWSLCAIEGGQLGLAGWAAATNALNLVTSQRPEPLPDPVLKALAELRWAGNNGWHDQPGKRDARRILRELIVAMPSIDADFVIGYMIAQGAFGDSAETLRKLMPVHRATVNVPVQDL